MHPRDDDDAGSVPGDEVLVNMSNDGSNPDSEKLTGTPSASTEGSLVVSLALSPAPCYKPLREPRFRARLFDRPHGCVRVHLFVVYLAIYLGARPPGLARPSA